MGFDNPQKSRNDVRQSVGRYWKKRILYGNVLCISRVCNLSSIVIEPITFDRLKCIGKSETLKYRLNEETTLKTIAKRTSANTLGKDFKCFFTVNNI